MGERTKRYYPAFLDLTGRSVVVLGSGPSVERKARQLVRYGADVTVVGPDPSEELVEAESDGHIIVEAREYVRGDLAGAALVVCASAEPEVQRAVFEEALLVGALVTVADNPKLSSFIVPGMVHREPLQIAVSTGGVAPQLAKRLRKQLSEQFGAAWGPYAELVAQVRAIGMERLEGPAQLEKLLDAVFESDTLDRVTAGEILAAEDVYEAFAPEPEPEPEPGPAAESEPEPAAEAGVEPEPEPAAEPEPAHGE
ncbi:MAG: bifunctional precorrin-2 dehydrogenase/sirohydrochlorin ferrochelatase [Coriobacteriia bacterium]|nr:bifunctional precorrin-2 dehydrogenase/sirohydrochlorin ferrochelatase [Coriobacteriia bacterium]